MVKKIVLSPRTARIVRIVAITVSAVTLFLGVILQSYGVDRVYNIPLSTFCEAYSGSAELLSSDQEALKKAELHVGWRGSASDMCLKKPCNKDQDPDCDESLAYWKFGWGGQLNGFISCSDMTAVYSSWLEFQHRLTDDNGIPYPNTDDAPLLTKAEIAIIADKSRTDCLAPKAGSAFIQGAGAIWTIVGAVIVFGALIFNDKTPLHVGHGVLSMTFAVQLVAIWFTSFMAASLVSSFASCAGNLDLSGKQGVGTFYTGQACVDVNSLGQTKNNPFMALYLKYEECFIAGVAMNMICILVLMASSFALVEPENIQAHAALTNPGTDMQSLTDLQQEEGAGSVEQNA